MGIGETKNHKYTPAAKVTVVFRTTNTYNKMWLPVECILADGLAWEAINNSLS